MKPRSPRQARFDVAVAMYQSGLSIQNCADYFQVSRQSMWKTLQRRIPLRPQKRTGEQNHFYRGGTTADGRAHNVVEQAVRVGLIERKTSCETCGAAGVFEDGRTTIQAHHDDYNKPLVVRWLCQPCHHEWHSKNKAIQLRK
jgi:transposase-like protein